MYHRWHTDIIRSLLIAQLAAKYSQLSGSETAVCKPEVRQADRQTIDCLLQVNDTRACTKSRTLPCRQHHGSTSPSLDGTRRPYDLNDIQVCSKVLLAHRKAAKCTASLPTWPLIGVLGSDLLKYFTRQTAWVRLNARLIHWRLPAQPGSSRSASACWPRDCLPGTNFSAAVHGRHAGTGDLEPRKDHLSQRSSGSTLFRLQSSIQGPDLQCQHHGDAVLSGLSETQCSGQATFQQYERRKRRAADTHGLAGCSWTILPTDGKPHRQHVFCFDVRPPPRTAFVEEGSWGRPTSSL
jgi:hypothetical protein